MTIDDLKKITAVFETGSINKAAEKLYLAQPAVSRSIKKIEEEYDITLFERSQGKRVVLTAEGQLFYNAAQDILLVHENLIRQLERAKMRNEHAIRFGTAPQQGVFLFGNMLKWFYRNMPDYQLETHASSSRQLHREVLTGELDVALINVVEQFEELHYEKNRRMYTNLYLSSKSTLQQRSRHIEGLDMPVIDVHDLEKETLIVNAKGSASRDALDRLAEKYHLKLKLIEENSSLFQRMKMADEGVGSYLLTSGSADVRPEWATGDPDRYVIVNPAQDLESWRYIVCRKGFEKTEKYRILKKCLREVGEER